MSEERIKITPEQLDSMMPRGKMVHSFMQGGMALIGADRSRASILKLAKGPLGAELSGESATSMNHGAVVWDEGERPVFIETTTEKSK